jgi:SAM-dependent methyltransferase
VELLDRPGVPPDEAERALRDLERVYRWLLFGGPLRRAVLAAVRGERGALVLDLGAGGGHVAADLARRGDAHRNDARRSDAAPKVVGLDIKLSHLLAGRRMGSPQVPVVADASALPFPPGAFACAFSHLFFHHLDEAANRRVIEQMRRVARRAVVIVDLRRSRLSRLLVRPCLRLLGLSPTAYHDGVVSAETSYALPAVADVVAGLPVRELRARFPFRWTLVVAGSDPG